MLKIQVNGQEFLFDHIQGTATLDGQAVHADAIKTGTDKYHLLINNQSYSLELLEKSENGKTMTVAVNGIKQEVTIRDRYDALLSSLGMDKMMGNKSHLLKAPMPGLVLRIMAEEGQHVKKGDPILVLEAMKMENVIKADGDGVIKRITVSPKQAVEKNTLLVEME